METEMDWLSSGKLNLSTIVKGNLEKIKTSHFVLCIVKTIRQTNDHLQIKSNNTFYIWINFYV